MTRSTEQALAEIQGAADLPLRKIERAERLKRELEKLIRWERDAAKRELYLSDMRIVEQVIGALHDSRLRHDVQTGT